jgi:DNA-binding MarR family transcriptional regulator
MEEKLDDIAEGLLQFFPLIRFLFRKAASDKPKVPSFRNQTYHVLGMLKGGGPLPISVIGKRLLIAKQNMTTITDRLIQEGSVERSHDPGDRRVTNIAITEKGVGILQEGRKSAKEVIRKGLSDLGDEDIRALHEAFGVITAIFEKVEKGGRHE